jgi:uncharacterized membrane protein YcaP (DUF421 family)
MDAIARGTAMYVFVLVIMRVAGKRSIAQITTFDFVLLLIIAEATQQALLGEDFSLTHAFLVIATLVGLDIGLSLVKDRWPATERWVDGVPVVIVERGRPLRDRMHRERVDEADVLTAAREAHGIARMDQIEYAVLERSGGISIIPKAGGG